MSSIKSSTSEDSNSDSRKDEARNLEAWELAKYRLRHLKRSYDEYVVCYDSYTNRYYLVAAVCCVVIFFGIVIVLLKFVGKESLLYSFKAIQSFSASLISGGSIAVYAGSIIFSSEKKEQGDDSKDEPKKEAIQLCTKGELGRKIDKMTKKLRDKKDSLEEAMLCQSVYLTLASVAVLFLVGIDFFGLLPDIKYFDIGLDLFISVIGCYVLYCICILRAILSLPREKLEKTRFILYFIVIPCAYLNGLMERTNEHWIKEVYLSQEARLEVNYLLRGLNPKKFSSELKKFNEELGLEDLEPPTKPPPNERTPLLPFTESVNEIELVLPFIESVNEIEFKANREVLKKYFEFGKSLAKRLQENNNANQPQGSKSIAERIISAGSAEEICNHYFDFDSGKGITIFKFFEKHPLHSKPKVKEIKAAHNALKVYSIFNVDEDLINRVKKITASCIGKFSRNEIIEVIQSIKSIKKKKKEKYKQSNDLNA